MTDELDYGTVLDSYVPLVKQAGASAEAVKNEDPDKASQAYTLGPKFGVSPQVVQWDLDGYKKQDQLNRNQAIVEQNPSLTRFTSDPDRAAAVQDDYEGLHRLSLTIDPTMSPSLTPFEGVGPEVDNDNIISGGIGRGLRRGAYGTLAYQQMQGDNSLATENTLKAYEAGMAGDPQHTGLAYYVNSAAEMFGQILGAGVRAQPSATASTIVGALGGELGGPIGSAIGGTVGYGTGLGYGVARDFAITSAGEQYRHLSQVRGLNGEQIPEDVKKTAATATGLMVGGLTAIGGPVLKKVATATLFPVMTKTLEQPGVVNAITKGVIGLSEAGIGGGMLNASMAFSQIAGGELAKTFSGGDFQTYLNDPKMRSEVNNQLVQTFTDGAILFGGLHTLPVGVNLVRDIATTRQTAIDARKLDAMVKAAQDTKVFRRNPEMVGEYVAEHDNIVPMTKVSAEKVAQFRDAFGYVPDLDQQLAKQVPVGGDVAIPTHDYMIKTDPDIHEQVKDDIRHGTGLTVNEAKLLEERDPNHYIDVYHGSPHAFDVFDISKIGTGEGAQAYGHGLYFAETRGIAEDYQRRLSQVDPDAAPSAGNLYQARIMRPQEHFLDWDVPFEQQSPYVQRRLQALGVSEAPKPKYEIQEKDGWYNILVDGVQDNAFGAKSDAEKYVADREKLRAGRGTGEEIHQNLVNEEGSKEAASKKLSEAGLAGIKYFDAGSRDGTRSTRNYVVFKDKDVEVTHVNDIARAVERGVVEAIAMQEKAMHLERPTAEGAPEGEYPAREKPSFLGPILTPEAAGMTKTDFIRYSKHLQDLQADIAKTALDVGMREAKRRQTPLWRDGLKKETEEARADLAERPDIKAYDYLTDPKLPIIKLDRNEVDAFMNSSSTEIAEQFRRDGTRWSERLPKSMFKETGEHPDVAADGLGFKSGREMLESLAGYERDRQASGLGNKQYVERLVKEEGIRRMEEKEGQLSKLVMDEALEHMMSVKQIEVLIDELKMLKPDAQLMRADILAKIDSDLGESRASSVRSRDQERLVGKYGLETERALLKGDAAGAFENKLKQTYNLIHLKAAREFEAEAKKAAKLIDKYSGSKTVDGVDQKFTDQIHQILESIDVNVARRSSENLTEAVGNVNLQQFMDNVLGETGYEVVNAEFLHDRPPTALTNMTVNEVRALYKTLASLNEIGREVNKIKVKERAEELAEVKGQVFGQLEPLALKREIDHRVGNVFDKTRGLGRYLDASLIKVEQLALWIDKNDPFGAFSTYIFRPLKEAEHARDDYLKEIAKQWDGLPTDNAWRRSLKDRIENTVLLDADGRAVNLTRKNLIAMALNWGNESNRRVLVKGNGWSKEAIEAILHDNMTENDWKVVQGIWKITEGMWGDVRRMTKEVTGVAPERVRGITVNTKFGDIEGGYFPLMKDSRALNAIKGGKVFDRPYGDTVMTSSATQDRTGAVYKVDLDLNRLPYVLRETVHDVFFRSAVIDVAKVMGDPKFNRLVDRAWGPEYSDMLGKWLKYVANDGGMPDPNSLKWLEAGSRNLRANAVTSLVGWRLGTAVIHGGSALANSISEVGLIPTLVQMNEMLHRNPVTMERRYREIINESGALRNRVHNLDRDLNQLMMRTLGQSWDRQAYQIFATKFIASLDMYSAVTVYAARKAKGLEKGLSEADASYAADQAVRLAHGSSGLTDLPAISRVGEYAKWLTMFYGYFNHNYNRIRDLGKLAGAPGKTGADYWNIVSRSVGYLVVPALIHAMLRQGPPEDDESVFAWGGKALGSQLGGGVPVVRDAVHALVHGTKPSSMSPLGEAVGGVMMPLLDVNKEVRGETPPAWLSHALQSAGWATGHLPGVSGLGPTIPLVGKVGQVLSASTTKTGGGQVQWLWDRAMDVPEDSDADYIRLILDGTAKARKHH